MAFIIYLNFTRSQSNYSTLFLQIILLGFVLQITKTVLELLGLEFSPYYHNLYLIGIYSQGPAMYLFIKKMLNPQLLIWPKQFLFHFLPWLILGLLKYNFNNYGIKEWIVIYLVGFQSLAYILICIKPYLSVRKLYLQKNKQFYIIYYLFPVFAALWIQFPVSGITHIEHHLFETTFYSAFVYYLMFLKIKEPNIEKDKYKFTGIDEETSRELFTNVSHFINEKELYLDPDLTLNTLAKKTTMQVNTLSQVINQNAHSNFRDFINTFRINLAKEQISLKVQKGFTIASVAYDCGFNSLSAFNRAFKKVTGLTPSDYIKTTS